MLFRSSFRFLHKTITRVKSFVSGCGCGSYHKLPKNSLVPFDHVPPRELGWDVELAAPTSRLQIQRSRGGRSYGRKAKGDDSGGLNGDREGSRRSRLVVRKLRELELLDLGNIEHALDVEEVIHYYSLLKCPVYRGIVEEFFREIYVELHGDSSAAGDVTAGR